MLKSHGRVGTSTGGSDDWLLRGGGLHRFGRLQHRLERILESRGSGHETGIESPTRLQSLVTKFPLPPCGAIDSEKLGLSKTSPHYPEQRI